MSNKYKLAIKIAVSFLLLIILIKVAHFENVISIIKNCNIDMLLIGFGIIFFGTLIASYRWFIVMVTLDFNLKLSFFIKSYLKGVFFNQLLPSSIGGDASRAINVIKKGYKKQDAIISILVDRGLGIFGIFLINLAFNIAFPTLLPESFYHAINIVSILGIIGFIVFIFLNKVPILNKIKFISQLSIALMKTMSSFFKSINQVLLTLIIHFLTFLGTYFIALSVGLQLPLTVFMIIMPPIILLTLLPVSLSGWGVRESAMVGILSLLGVSNDLALSVSLLYGFSYIVQAIFGLYFIVVSRENIKELQFES